MSQSDRLDRPLLGIMLIAFAVLAFSITDVLMKYLADRHPVGVILAFRYVVSFIMLTVLLWPKYGKRLWQTNRTGMVVIRGIVLTIASVSMGFALQRMPIAETTSIIYISPLIVMVLSVPLLGERITILGWLGALVGFAGVLLIMRPGGGLDPIGVAFALFNAVCTTAYQLLSRLLSRTETTMALLYFATLVGAVSFSLMALFLIGDFHPSLTDIGMLTLMGVAATTGHFLFTAAFREAPASMLAPVSYMHLFWAAGLGWVVFDHIPTSLSIVGIIMVAGSGALTAIKAKRHKKSPLV